MKQLINHINGRNLGIVFPKETTTEQICGWLCLNLFELEDEIDFLDIEACDAGWDDENNIIVVSDEMNKEFHALEIQDLKLIKIKKWIYSEEVWGGKTWYMVSDGNPLERTFSYDYKTKKAALKELDILNKQ